VELIPANGVEAMTATRFGGSDGGDTRPLPLMYALFVGDLLSCEFAIPLLSYFLLSHVYVLGFGFLARDGHNRPKRW
jgi:hypothetical protein